MIFHLDYSEKACQALVMFNNSLKAGSHDPIFGSDFYSNSNKLLMQINTSIVSQPSKCLKFISFREGSFAIRN